MSDEELYEEVLRILSKYVPKANTLIKPTLLHCVRVGIYLHVNGYKKETVLAGFLHDMLEDTDYSAEELRLTFGEEVLIPKILI